jgi:hypothetical protein
MNDGADGTGVWTEDRSGAEGRESRCKGGSAITSDKAETSARAAEWSGAGDAVAVSREWLF